MHDDGPLGIRLRAVNQAAMRRDGDYVLYWMIAQRRTRWNAALEHAARRAAALGRPLLVFEPLRAGYRWASDRIHRFVVDGMADNAAACAAAGVSYVPYVEPVPDAGKGLLDALARHACCVVTDEWPAFFLPRAVAAAGRRLGVRLEAVDGCGLLPLRASPGPFPNAVTFRRFLQHKLPAFLRQVPAEQPLALAPRRRVAVPAEVLRRWPAASAALLAGEAGALARVLIDHRVAPVAGWRGGARAAAGRLSAFLAGPIARYLERSHPDEDVCSGLSPYLHFGHVSPHEVVAAVLARAGWSPERLARTASGRREGWWGVDAASEAFLDQIVTWRELGFADSFHRADNDTWESLPEWARATLEEHARDPREHVYTLDQLATGATHDALWNAAQRQLVEEGRIQNYLRMLWGKRILEWRPHPRDALAAMLELNNRFALDGRDPNSISGIAWVLGRFDRPWAPERPIYGSIRYMSSANTIRKLRIDRWLQRWAGTERQETLL